ncbi:DUF2793 domain-containing protein [Novosphingobium sp. 9]|uniref:DUF2793 domain-containing protein n=1 Tax=Novosphingobium sp. 9 TaxID=2025349 RepID=UPI0021B65D06|nr:DUF2793 domain-containing protein [Novosphingobium sp. 9]
MTDPIAFSSTTPRFSLPLLFSGQAQKEVFVNESLARTDALLHCTVKGVASAPPEAMQEGDSWVVASDASGDFAGQDDAIACFQQGSWVFISPCEGMRIFNLATASDMLFFENWQKPATPQEPLGGSVVDGEARAAINALISALQALGVLPSV